MNAWSVVLQILTVGSLPGSIVAVLTVRAVNRKMSAEAKKLDTEHVHVLVGAATELLDPLRKTAAETREELAEAKRQIQELSAEIEHQRIVINEMTLKLDAANRRADQATQRADYYQRAFDARAESEGA